MGKPFLSDPELGAGVVFPGGGSDPDDDRAATATQTNTTVTPAEAIELTVNLTPGTYVVKHWIVYRAAATTTGIELFLDFTGTVTRLVSHWFGLSTGTTATSGVMDQAGAGTTAQMMEGKGQRADNVASGVTAGVDTAAADMLAIMESVIVVTATGDLKLMFRSEVAASGVSIESPSVVTYRKVA